MNYAQKSEVAIALQLYRLSSLHSIVNVQETFRMNPVATESAGDKPEGSRNVRINHALKNEVAIVLRLYSVAMLSSLHSISNQ